MISDKFKEWWKSQSEFEKVKHIKSTSQHLVKNQISKEKAMLAEMNSGFNRVGKRGGKLTTLTARSQNKTKMYLDCQEQLHFMIKNL